MSKSVSEKWVLCSTVHLGIARDSFPPGTVIEHLPEESAIIIEGKRYDSDRDLTALRILEKKTGKKWLVPFSAAAVTDARKTPSSLAKDKPAMVDEGHKSMPIIHSDRDSREDIDISSTKNRPHSKNDSQKMDVIRGDENATERLARLQREGIPSMPIVRDDSLGEVSGPTRTGGIVKSPPADKAGRHDAKPITGTPEVKVCTVDMEALPKGTEIHSVPPVTASAPVDSAPVKNRGGRPLGSKNKAKKAKQVATGGNS